MSPSPYPLDKLRDSMRGLLVAQEQKPSLDLDEKISSLTESLKEQGRLARLFEKGTEAEREGIREELREKAQELVGESKEEGNLKKVVEKHEETSALLGLLQWDTRRHWARFDLLIIGAEAVLAFLLVSFLAHVGITLVVFELLSESSAWGTSLLLTLFVFFGVCDYSSLAARQRAQNADYAFRWQQWLKGDLLHILLVSLALWWTYFHGAAWRQASLSDVSLFSWTAGLMLVVPAAYVGYRRLKPRVLSRQGEAKTHMKPREQELKRSLSHSEGKAEEIIAQLIRDATTELEQNRGIRPTEWDLKVPHYPLEDSWRKLSERYESFINTEALKQLKGYVTTLDTASIGIAGQRGAGKTSVMYALRDEIEPKHPDTELPDPGWRRFLTIWISAPTAIAEKEFLLSVLAKLATRVGARLTGNPFWPNFSAEEETRRADSERRHMGWAVAVGLAAALVYLAVLFRWYKELITRAEWTWLALPTIVLAAPLILWAGRWLRQNVKPRPFGEQRPAERAFLHATDSLLEELWFEHKEVTSSEISTAPLGVDLSAGLSRERTKKPFTLPRLVQMWDDYITNVAAADGAFGKVVIFIDEVDKIKETAEIGRFMRILKTLFKPSRLFFVVSISEDAYNQFQVRGVRKEQRNEFDSSFDQTVKVKRMTYKKTAELLDSRIRGDLLPRPFVQLIWAISRGNARDSIRLARDILEKHQRKESEERDKDREKGTLSQVTRELVKEYILQPLLEHSGTSLRKKRISRDAASLFQTLDRIWESILEDPVKAMDRLNELDKFIRREREAMAKGETNIENSSVRELEQIKADLYHAITLCVTFDNSADVQRFQEMGNIEEPDEENRLRRRLLRAQAELEDRLPELACSTLNEFHTELKLIPPSREPEAARPRYAPAGAED